MKAAAANELIRRFLRRILEFELRAYGNVRKYASRTFFASPEMESGVKIDLISIRFIYKILSDSLCCKNVPRRGMFNKFSRFFMIFNIILGGGSQPKEIQFETKALRNNPLPELIFFLFSARGYRQHNQFRVRISDYHSDGTPQCHIRSASSQ